MNTDKIFVVIPCYNDSKTIRQTVSGLLPYGYSVIVVNDGSSQNIRDEIADLPVIYAAHRINLGQGAALQTGTEIALSHDAAIILHFDSDGQHSVLDIPNMIQPLLADEADIVIGSRFLKKADTNAVPYRKRMLLRAARLVNWIFSGIWLTDAHNGFRAMNRLAASKLNLRENRMGHASEILVKIKKQKLRYAERATHIIYSEYSLSKGQPAINSINILIDLILNRIFK